MSVPSVLVLTCLLFPPNETAKETSTLDYVRDIKPILKFHCIDCHGVDEQESGLRLDAAQFIRKGGNRGKILMEGDAANSMLLQVLIKSGNIPQMPPESDPLPEKEIAILKRWIDAGAKMPSQEIVNSADNLTSHWAFQPRTHPTPPAIENSRQIHNPIDNFILATLRKKHLTLSPEAAKEVLVRRVSFDVRGLPPSWEEVQQFLKDDRTDAYERMVDRMLSSPHYGERWGRHWLDLARYADSHGFTIDGARQIWKYRDWVIDSFNRDLPFDQFTIEQLAGDLLPNPKTNQLIATGFHRNTLINQEGGTDQEQFRIEAVVDRVNTTGAVWMGLTVGCAQCHEHKYDPISQREYYEMFAIFNSQDEPNIQVPSEEQKQILQQLEQKIAKAEKPLKEHDARFLKGYDLWLATLAKQTSSEPSWTSMRPTKMSTEKQSVLNLQKDNSIFVDFSGPDKDTFILEAELPQQPITAIRLEALTHSSLPKKGPGRAGNGNFVLNEFEVLVQQNSENAKPIPVKLTHAVADHSQENYSVKDAIDGNRDKTGWAINVRSGSLNVNREAIFFPEVAIPAKDHSQIIIKLHQNHGSRYMLGNFRISFTNDTAESLKIPQGIRKLLAKPSEKRSKSEREQLISAYRETDSDRIPLAQQVAELKRKKGSLQKSIPTTMVLKERTSPRKTHIHIRGDFLNHGAEVEAGVPAIFPPMNLSHTDQDESSAPKFKREENRRATRLDFAKWLVSHDHPLTARVTVNRIWQRYFGRGLVATENDFGTQGIPPSHPELLDWLANEFISQNWSMKELHRLILTSATYRQSSDFTDPHRKYDPNNLYLARQSRVRLEAEIVRDAALKTAGLLSPTLKGPSVHPPQPQGIYVLTQQKKPWNVDVGPNRYRRGMYTYFWRSSPYPMLMTFDAPDATTTCTRRTRSNTPLQALTLANDPAFVEMAQAFGQQIQQYPQKLNSPESSTQNAVETSIASRIRYAFQAALSREPRQQEVNILCEFYQKQLSLYQSQPEAAKQLAMIPTDKSSSPAELAAWTAVARVILNLDEFITRE